MKELKQTTTMQRARIEVGEALGQTDRDEQFRIVNRIRQWVYANQKEYGLDLSVGFCQPISCFCLPCPECPGDKARGFRLPHNYHSLAAANSKGHHASIHSSFQLPYDNISSYEGELGSVHLFKAGTHPFRRDLPNCCPAQICYQASCTPNGYKEQPMAITGVLAGEEHQQTLQYKVTRSRKKTDDFWDRVDSVVFCDGVVGMVTMSTEDGPELARYQCNETVPMYQEYRAISPCADNLIVRGYCNFTDLFDDCDIVEFGDLNIWSSLARVTSILRKKDMNANDRANLKTHLEIATRLMKATNSIGDSAEDTVFRRKPIKGGRLSSSRYGARRR